MPICDGCYPLLQLDYEQLDFLPFYLSQLCSFCSSGFDEPDLLSSYEYIRAIFSSNFPYMEARIRLRILTSSIGKLVTGLSLVG
jgi:hypothetical protein